MSGPRIPSGLPAAARPRKPPMPTGLTPPPGVWRAGPEIVRLSGAMPGRPRGSEAPFGENSGSPPKAMPAFTANKRASAGSTMIRGSTAFSSRLMPGWCPRRRRWSRCATRRPAYRTTACPVAAGRSGRRTSSRRSGRCASAGPATITISRWPTSKPASRRMPGMFFRARSCTPRLTGWCRAILARRRGARTSATARTCLPARWSRDSSAMHRTVRRDGCGSRRSFHRSGTARGCGRRTST